MNRAGWLGAAAALALLGCAGETSAPPAPGSAGDPLRIAAWNTEHLAAEPGTGCEPRDEAGYALVRDVIEEVDADVWLLQEIENEAALQQVFPANEWSFHIEARPDTGPGPECWGRDDGARLRMQRTAIVVRDTVEHSRGPDLAALDVGGRGFLRHGVAVTLEHEGREIDLLGVHLKSGCFSGDRSDACPTLFDQIPVVEAWIDQRSAAGRAVIVGGDFNRRLALADDTVWADLDDGDPTGLVIAGEGARPQCDPRYDQFIDFIVANDAAAERIDDRSFRETTFADVARASDHCPISIEVQ